MEVTLGIFDLERGCLLHWRGQSLYRQTQHKEHHTIFTGQWPKWKYCTFVTEWQQPVAEMWFYECRGQQTYAARTAAGIEPAWGLSSEDGDTTAYWVAVIRLCKRSQTDMINASNFVERKQDFEDCAWSYSSMKAKAETRWEFSMEFLTILIVHWTNACIKAFQLDWWKVKSDDPFSCLFKHHLYLPRVG